MRSAPRMRPWWPTAPKAQSSPARATSVAHRSTPSCATSRSLKSTAHAEVRFTVRSRAGAGQEVRLRFCVDDYGIGIGASQLATIFQPFEQAADVQRRYVVF